MEFDVELEAVNPDVDEYFSDMAIDRTAAYAVSRADGSVVILHHLDVRAAGEILIKCAAQDHYVYNYCVNYRYFADLCR